MLAQNFKTPADLGIKDAQFDALCKVLGMLEREEIKHVPAPHLTEHNCGGNTFTGRFNMAAWRRDDECGTVCCIGGTAEIVGLVSFSTRLPESLRDLFYPTGAPLSEITSSQAARALRSYLTTGDANWRESLAVVSD